MQYVPEVFVLHRVDLKLRKAQTKDFTLRYRRGLRAGWFAIFLFIRQTKPFTSFCIRFDAMQNKSFQRTVQGVVTNIGSTLGFNCLQFEDSKTEPLLQPVNSPTMPN